MPLNVQCKRCANLQNDWCKLVVDSPDPDLVRDCRHYRTLRNADRIRAMTDEELAKLLNGTHGDFLPTGEPLTVSGGYSRWLDWLKQGASE